MPLLLSLTLGTRISETIGIIFKDIDFSDTSRIYQAPLGRAMEEEDAAFLVSSPLETKTTNGIRSIPLPEWVIDEIYVYRARYEINKKNITDFYDLDMYAVMTMVSLSIAEVLQEILKS